ncbi:hypothetical protein KY359_03260 [Candidatus Woesearchaeota archaeon]|nr:hypothetical protein [Candidatus Woesearchaeota archaeon]
MADKKYITDVFGGQGGLISDITVEMANRLSQSYNNKMDSDGGIDDEVLDMWLGYTDALQKMCHGWGINPQPYLMVLDSAIGFGEPVVSRRGLSHVPASVSQGEEPRMTEVDTVIEQTLRYIHAHRDEMACGGFVRYIDQVRAQSLTYEAGIELLCAIGGVDAGPRIRKFRTTLDNL